MIPDILMIFSLNCLYSLQSFSLFYSIGPLAEKIIVLDALLSFSPLSSLISCKFIFIFTQKITIKNMFVHRCWLENRSYFIFMCLMGQSWISNSRLFSMACENIFTHNETKKGYSSLVFVLDPQRVTLIPWSLCVHVCWDSSFYGWKYCHLRKWLAHTANNWERRCLDIYIYI